MRQQQISLDWRLHAPIVFQVLRDLKYFEHRGISFEMHGFTIHRDGGWMYSPSHITSFRDALRVLRDNGCATTPHFDAIALLEGVSYHRILDKGRKLLARLQPERMRCTIQGTTGTSERRCPNSASGP